MGYYILTDFDIRNIAAQAVAVGLVEATRIQQPRPHHQERSVPPLWHAQRDPMGRRGTGERKAHRTIGKQLRAVFGGRDSARNDGGWDKNRLRPRA